MTSNPQLRILSVIMPVYNEASTVADVIRKVLEQPQVAELIVVDDGSTDRTWEILQEEATRLNAASPSPSSDLRPPLPTPVPCLLSI